MYRHMRVAVYLSIHTAHDKLINEYACVYIYVYKYKYTCKYIYIYMYVCIIYIYTCIYIYIYVPALRMRHLCFRRLDSYLLTILRVLRGALVMPRCVIYSLADPVAAPPSHWGSAGQQSRS